MISFFVFNLIVSICLYLPFFLFLCLCAWAALIEKIRHVTGVEKAVMDYLKDKEKYERWKRYLQDEERAEAALSAAERGE